MSFIGKAAGGEDVSLALFVNGYCFVKLQKHKVLVRFILEFIYITLEFQRMCRPKKKKKRAELVSHILNKWDMCWVQDFMILIAYRFDLIIFIETYAMVLIDLTTVDF